MQGKRIPDGAVVRFVRRVYGTDVKAGDRARVLSYSMKTKEYELRFVRFGNKGYSRREPLRLDNHGIRFVNEADPIWPETPKARATAAPAKAAKEGSPGLADFVRDAVDVASLSVLIKKLVDAGMEKRELERANAALFAENRKLREHALATQMLAAQGD